jgi:hypothetical protein
MFARPAFSPTTVATICISLVLSPRILVFPLVGKAFVPENDAVLAPAAPSVDLVYREIDYVVGNVYLDIGSSPALHTVEAEDILHMRALFLRPRLLRSQPPCINSGLHYI